jgi:ribonuclease HI
MSTKTPQVIQVIQVIYTDGSCMPNPGPGGWGFVVLPFDSNDPNEWHVSGGNDQTTNNRMELTAVIEALDFVKNKNSYRIYSDSMYVIKCAQGIWARKKNIDLWRTYEKVSKNKKIEWVWVKAHNGDKYNEIVDKLAKKEAKSKK